MKNAEAATALHLSLRERWSAARVRGSAKRRKAPPPSRITSHPDLRSDLSLRER